MSRWNDIRTAPGIRRKVSAALGLTFTNNVTLPSSSSDGSLFTTNLSRNSIVVACIRWMQRNISEAPPILQRWLPDAEEWEDVLRPITGTPGTRLLALLKRPNDCYPGTSLWKSTIEDLVLSGNAYWILTRNGAGAVDTIWWIPSTRIRPVAVEGSPLGRVSYFEMQTRDGPIRYSIQDVVHFRDGIDPDNPCLGRSGIGSIVQEVLLDEKAAGMATTLMSTAGHGSAIFSPVAGKTFTPDAARQLQEAYNTNFTGSGSGRAMVTQGPIDVRQIAYTPAQLEMQAQRRYPEERISSVIGVNAAVAGLGSGLNSVQVGATLFQYREEAFESTIIPWYRDLQEHLTQQLLPRFGLGDDWRLVFDLKGIRVLQEDEMVRTERVARLVTDGIITVAEGRRALGYPVKPEHEIYLRPVNERMTPTGPLRVQTGEPSPNGTTGADEIDPEELSIEALLRH